MVMAQHTIRALGGCIGVTTFITSIGCIIAAMIASMVAMILGYKINTDISESYEAQEQRVLYNPLLYSIIALFSAMVTENMYFIVVVARAIYSRNMPPLGSFFYFLLAFYWFFFMTVQALLITTLKNIGEKPINPFTIFCAYISMTPLLVSTLPMHARIIDTAVSVDASDAR